MQYLFEHKLKIKYVKLSPNVTCMICTENRKEFCLRSDRWEFTVEWEPSDSPSLFYFFLKSQSIFIYYYFVWKKTVHLYSLAACKLQTLL